MGILSYFYAVDSMLRSNRLLRISLAGLLLTIGLSHIVVADDPPSAVGPLMKLFQSGRLPAERQGTVVEMICNRGNEHDLRVVFDKIVSKDGFTPKLRLQAMGWLTDAATNRKLKPTGELDALSQLALPDPATADRTLQIAAIRLAAMWKLPSISKTLQKLALDPKSSPEIHRIAITGLINIGDDDAHTTIRKLTAKEYPLPIRMQSVAGLAGFDLPAAASAAVQVLQEVAAKDDTGPMIDAFLNRKEGPETLAMALANQTIPVDSAKVALRYMYSVGRSDGSLSEVLGKLAGVAADTPPPTQEEVAKYVVEVMEKGNAERGEKIFRRIDLSCMKCHSISGAGGQIGPDLSAVGGSSPTDYIVNSILNPSLAVKEQFVTRIFVMTSGEVFNGIVTDRNDVKIQLKDASGKQITLPAADVDEEIEGKSLMPQGLTKFLTHQEFLDLAKFISELGKPGPYAPRKTPSIQRWRVLRNPSAELTAEVPHLEHVRELILGSASQDWDAAYGKLAGVLPLAELRSGTTPTVLILQGEIEVSEMGQLEVRLSSTETAQIWVDAQPFDSQKSFGIDLTPGRHRITVRVEVSERPEPELKVELVKPESSKIQFQVIGGA